MQKFFIVLISLICSVGSINAQIKEDVNEYFVNDSTPLIVEDYDKASEEITLDNPKFSPDPMKAIWYSALFPGGGQLYNRKYWKIPIIYGGYMGLTYAVTWNQRYYKGYATAYRELVENSPNKSYLDYVRPGFDVETNRDWLENALKRRKDSYRRYRDLSIICMAAVYLLTMVDAYVDASLYHFDISPDISMQVTPALIEKNSFHATSLGLQCSFNF
ncbi:MAG: DUF5683 domain-containing protein [Bacteroidales bacterium]|nr:DUF5683 domain-containing protein [Bacteroidales bacterium]